MSKIAIVGNGNVGLHLAKSLSIKHTVTCFSRAPKDGIKSLASLQPSKFDFILLTVPDGAIKGVAEQLVKSNAIVLHTSGSRPLSDLNKHHNIGVFYPLQTFSKEKEVDFSKVQVFIEGSAETEKKIAQLAKSISQNVIALNSEKRAKMHLAAVFACNFSNHMFHLAQRQLNEIGMQFQDLLPLVDETVAKALALNPSNSQTGPAVRHDQVTIDRHLQMLQGDERKIYQMLTNDIQKYT